MIFRTFGLVVVACSLLGLQGCSKRLDGDVFVLNKDGSSNKLALVDVYAVPLNALTEFEKVANAKRDREKAEVMATLASLDLKGLNEEHIAVLEIGRRVFAREVDRTLKGISDFIGSDPVGEALSDKHRKMDVELNKKIIAKFKASDVNALYKKVQSLAPSDFYPQEIKSHLTDASVKKVVSDSDGKFTMDLKSEDVVLVAIAKGKDGNPVHFWLVKLPANEKRITLSDANSFEKGCPTCLLAGTDKTLDPAKELPMAVYVIGTYPTKNDYELSKERVWIFDFAKKANLF